jgi:threonine dehydratase
MIGIDFGSATERAAFLRDLPRHGEGYRSCRPLDEAFLRHLLGR